MIPIFPRALFRRVLVPCTSGFWHFGPRVTRFLPIAHKQKNSMFLAHEFYCSVSYILDLLPPTSAAAAASGSQSKNETTVSKETIIRELCNRHGLRPGHMKCCRFVQDTRRRGLRPKLLRACCAGGRSLRRHPCKTLGLAPPNPRPEPSYTPAEDLKILYDVVFSCSRAVGP